MKRWALYTKNKGEEPVRFPCKISSWFSTCENSLPSAYSRLLKAAVGQWS